MDFNKEIFRISHGDSGAPLISYFGNSFTFDGVMIGSIDKTGVHFVVPLPSLCELLYIQEKQI